MRSKEWQKQMTFRTWSCVSAVSISSRGTLHPYLELRDYKQSKQTRKKNIKEILLLNKKQKQREWSKYEKWKQKLTSTWSTIRSRGVKLFLTSIADLHEENTNRRNFKNLNKRCKGNYIKIYKPPSLKLKS